MMLNTGAEAGRRRRAADHRGPGWAGRARRVRARGGGVHRRGGGPVAARRVAADRAVGRRRGAGRPVDVRRRGSRARVRGAGRAALGPVGSEELDRADARHRRPEIAARPWSRSPTRSATCSTAMEADAGIDWHAAGRWRRGGQRRARSSSRPTCWASRGRCAGWRRPRPALRSSAGWRRVYRPAPRDRAALWQLDASGPDPPAMCADVLEPHGTAVRPDISRTSAKGRAVAPRLVARPVAR